jgi:hypothetical protein
VPERLGPDVAGQMGSGIGVTVGMAVETGYTATRPFRTSVFGLIELLLRERCEQQPQTLDLLGI